MKKLILMQAVAMLILLVASCEKEPKEDKIPPAKETFAIDFELVFNGKPINLNEDAGITLANDSLKFTRIALLLSDFEVENDQGVRIALPDTNALINLGTSRRTLQFKGDLPQGKFTKLHFKIGLDSATNFGDPGQYSLTHPLNPLVNQLFWDWAGGYVFMATEGYFKNNNEDQIFTYHMANMDFVKQISLAYNSGFDLSKNNGLRIQVDMFKYFSTPEVYSIKLEGSSSHSTSQEDMIIMNKLRKNLDHVMEINKID
jgi:hypothetical protein